MRAPRWQDEVEEILDRAGMRRPEGRRPAEMMGADAAAPLLFGLVIGIVLGVVLALVIIAAITVAG